MRCWTAIGLLAAAACGSAAGTRDAGGPSPARADATIAGAADAGDVDAAPAPDAAAEDAGPPDLGLFPQSIPAEPQRDGDPMLGYQTVVDGKYVGCGVPYSVFQLAGQDMAPAADRLPGRSGPNSTM